MAQTELASYWLLHVQTWRRVRHAFGQVLATFGIMFRTTLLMGQAFVQDYSISGSIVRSPVHEKYHLWRERR